MNPPVNGKIQRLFKAFECFSSTFQGKFDFQGLFKTVLSSTFQACANPGQGVTDRSKAVLLLCYLCFVFVMLCLLVTCLERASLLALVCDVFCVCVFVTFPCGVLGQVWYLIVLIPDLCPLTLVGPLARCKNIEPDQPCLISKNCVLLTLSSGGHHVSYHMVLEKSKEVLVK